MPQHGIDFKTNEKENELKVMKASLFFAGIAMIFALFLASGPASAGDKPQGTQTKCPVMGGEIDRSLYVDVDGKRVYLCCPGCSEKFTEDAAKYVEQMEKEGVELEKAP
ncbi:MAG: hypothetical protein ACLGPL_05495 [Acidobacteriota bacterium]